MTNETWMERGGGKEVVTGSEKEMSFTVLTLKILPRHFVEEYRPKPVRKEKLFPQSALWLTEKIALTELIILQKYQPIPVLPNTQRYFKVSAR